MQSQIVLRNLQIPASSVDRFDASAVYLADSTIVHWDDVLKAKLAEPGSVNEADLARQNSFDAILASRGQPLFQVRHRLALGDWLSLAEVAEPLYRELKAFPESPEMARQEYLISLGTLYARLSRGDRAGAVPPFLRACRLKAEFDFDSGLPPAVNLSSEQVRDRLHPRLVPVFFDPVSAGQQLEGRAIDVDNSDPRDRVYLVALAIAAGQYDLARGTLVRLQGGQENWAKIFSSQLELVDQPASSTEPIRDRQWREGLTTSQAAVVDYILAMVDSRNATDADAATLAFLQLVAENQEKDRQLAAAALYQAFLIAEKNDRLGEAKIFKSELLDKYPETYHGQKIKSSKQP
ncbi:MAG: hypothetical protein MK108_02595 [Mariniblastus sp.]|nr:hypothetical protein [Mariniblastus sp.]